MREPLIEALMKIGVNARSYFQPVHLMPAYKRAGVSLPRTEAISASVIALPQGFSVDEPVIAEIGRCMDQVLAATRHATPAPGGRPPRHLRTTRKGARAVA